MPFFSIKRVSFGVTLTMFLKETMIWWHLDHFTIQVGDTWNMFSKVTTIWWHLGHFFHESMIWCHLDHVFERDYDLMTTGPFFPK